MFQPLLEVNLATGSCQSFELPREVRERWIGGLGLGLYLLSREIDTGLRPTDPDCPVFVLTGPLTGTSVPQSSDWVIVTLNAEFSKNICASHAHGFFGARLRQAGWDGIILRGRAEAPVYLSIDDDRAELHPAGELWGLDTFETQRRLIGKRGRGDAEVSVFCIGPAGENLVEGASVRGDLAYGASQGGPGIAWGAKNLKAIVTSGTTPVRVEDSSRLDAISAEWQKDIEGVFPGFPQVRNYDGLTMMSGWLGEIGWIPGKNFTDPEFGPRWQHEFGRVLPKWKIEGVGSWNCEAACHFHAQCTTGPMAGMEFSGYGGEVMEELGPNLGIEDPGIAFMLAGVVDGYGMAAKSAPRTIAMLMEAFEAGEIGLEQTNGIDLRWGNYDAVLTLLELTIKREGIGELIAQGLRPTAQALGIESRAMHMHGVGFNDHDQRALPIFLFQSQVASGAGPTIQTLLGHMMGGNTQAGGRPEPAIGFDELLAADDLDQLAKATSMGQKAKLLYDCIGVCFFAAVGFEGILRFVSESLDAAVGIKLKPQELLEAGERIIALQRLITVYLGYRPDDDFDMADRLFEKISGGPASGSGLTRQEFGRTREEFYELQGWSLETGAPTTETLNRLGLADFQIGKP